MYRNFIRSFLKKMKNLLVIPKFIIFASSKLDFIGENSDLKFIFSKGYFNYGDVQTSFDNIIAFIKNDEGKLESEISDFDETLQMKNKKDEINMKNKILQQELKLNLDYIDNEEKLYLPTYFRIMIKITDGDKKHFSKFTKDLYKEYSDNDKIHNLLSQIINLKNIPFELLCKYWARAYTAEQFHYDMNNYLKSGKTWKYTLFIKMMFEGVRLKALESPIVDTLYRGAQLDNEEIEKMKNFIKKKKKNLPCAILFSNVFLSFSRSKKKAIKFAMIDKFFDGTKMKRVIFELKGDNYLITDFNTHADISKLSFFKKEEEVLFFPYSCFELIDIYEINDSGVDFIKINLNYLSHFDSKLKDKKNLKKINSNKSLIDSEFKKEIKKVNLIDEHELDKCTVSSIINNSNVFIHETNELIKNNESFKSNYFDENNHNNDSEIKNILQSFHQINNPINSSSEIIVNNKNDNNALHDEYDKNCFKKNWKVFLILIILSIAAIIIVIVIVIKKKKNSDKEYSNLNNYYTDIIMESIRLIENSYIIINSDKMYNTDIKIQSDITEETFQTTKDSENIERSNTIDNSDDTNISEDIENPDDFYKNIDENSELYEIALTELEYQNSYRKEYNVADLIIDLDLIQLAYENIIEIANSGNIKIGGKTKKNGEKVSELMLLHFSNNTYTLGYAIDTWYNSITNSNDKEKMDIMLSNKTTHFGFGAICFSNACIAIAYYYPSDIGSSYAVVD